MVASCERRNTLNYSNRSRRPDTVLPGTVLDDFSDDYRQVCSCSTSFRSMYSASVVERY
jgi:hypothetical protein